MPLSSPNECLFNLLSLIPTHFAARQYRLDVPLHDYNYFIYLFLACTYETGEQYLVHHLWYSSSRVSLVFLSPVSCARDSRLEKLLRLRWLEPASSAHDWHGGGKNSYMRYCSLPSVCIDCILSHNGGRGSTAIGRCQALLLSFTFFIFHREFHYRPVCLSLRPLYLFPLIRDISLATFCWKLIFNLSVTHLVAGDF